MSKPLLLLASLVSGILLAQAPVSIGILRPAQSQYYLDKNHTYNPYYPTIYTFFPYAAGDLTITGDWNGDGTTKLGVYRAGTFYLDYNGNGVWDGPSVDRQYAFSTYTAGDIPVVGDWTGNGQAKIGIYRGGFWLLDMNGNGTWDGSPNDRLIGMGGASSAYIPVVGDWNGDGRAKGGVYNAGQWTLDYNGDGIIDGNDKQYTFSGLPGDIPVVGDWTGDGKAKIGIYHAGFWLLDLNGNGVWEGAPADQLTAFGGNPNEVPVVGDWNGDGRAKVGVYFGAGYWWLDANGNGKWDGYAVDFNANFGIAGDFPVTGKWTAATPRLPNSLSIQNGGSVGHGSATPQIFSFNYTDIYGAGNISSGQVEFIDSANSGIARCNFQWTRSGTLNLFSTGASTSTADTVLSDNFCSVALKSVVASTADPTMVTATFSIAFFQNYLGIYGVQTQVVDNAGFQTSWGQVGTYKVDQSPIGPLSGTGANQTFTVSAADPSDPIYGSYTNIKNVQVMFNWSFGNVDACYLNYDAVNDLLYLADQSGNTGTTLPIHLKSGTGDLGDDGGTFNCKVFRSGSSVSGSGPSLLLNLNIKFESSFIGLQYSFLSVSDDISHAAPVQIGKWTAHAADPTPPLPVVPSGVSVGGIITMNYQDTNQFGYVPAMYVQFGPSLDNPANCRFIYQRGTGVQNHTVTLFGSGWDKYIDQRVVGVPGVPIESPGRCKIDLSKSQALEGGIYGGLNLALTLYNADSTNHINVWEFPIDRAAVSNMGTTNFSIAAQSISLTNDSIDTGALQVGNSTTYTVSLGSIGNFSGSVSVTCSATGNLTCAGSTVIVPANGSVNATITVTAPSSATVGTQKVTVSATAGGPHTLDRAFNITAVPIAPSVTFSANQAQYIPYGTDAYYTVTVTGNSTWPAGRQVTLSTSTQTGAVGASFWIGTPGSGYPTEKVTVSVPGSALYRMFASYPGANSYYAYLSASDAVTYASVATTSLNLNTSATTIPGASLSVVSSVTIPAGGSITTPVGLSAPISYSSSVSLSATSSAGSTVALASSTLTTSSSILATISSGTLKAGDSFQVTIVATGGLTRTIQGTIAPNFTENPDDPLPPSLTYSPLPIYTGSYVYNDGTNSVTYTYACIQHDPKTLAATACTGSYSCGVGTLGGILQPGITAIPAPINIDPLTGNFLLKFTASNSVPADVYLTRCYKTVDGFNNPIAGSLTLQVLDATAKPVITSVCDGGVTTSSCSEPTTPTGNIKEITINGTNLITTTGASPVIKVWGPSGASTYTTSLDVQLGATVSATQIDVSVTVPNGALVGDYDVAVFPNGTTSTTLGFQGEPQQPKSNGMKGLNVSTCAIPTNWQEVHHGDVGSGVLEFHYTYDSSTGNIADLQGCMIGEFYGLPESDNPWRPPFPQHKLDPNPTINEVFAVRPLLSGVPNYRILDDHMTTSFGNWRPPYFKTSFSTFPDQQYYYRCACQNYQRVKLAGPFTIKREINSNGDGTWGFVITKNSFSATINPLP